MRIKLAIEDGPLYRGRQCQLILRFRIVRYAHRHLVLVQRRSLQLLVVRFERRLLLLLLIVHSLQLRDGGPRCILARRLRLPLRERYQRNVMGKVLLLIVNVAQCDAAFGLKQAFIVTSRCEGVVEDLMLMQRLLLLRLLLSLQIGVVLPTEKLWSNMTTMRKRNRTTAAAIDTLVH